MFCFFLIKEAELRLWLRTPFIHVLWSSYANEHLQSSSLIVDSFRYTISFFVSFFSEVIRLKKVNWDQHFDGNMSLTIMEMQCRTHLPDEIVEDMLFLGWKTTDNWTGQEVNIWSTDSFYLSSKRKSFAYFEYSWLWTCRNSLPVNTRCVIITQMGKRLGYVLFFYCNSENNWTRKSR